MLKFAKVRRVVIRSSASLLWPPIMTIAVLAASATGCTPTTQAELEVQAAYLKRPVPGATLTAGYGEVRNNADRRICAVSFESSIAGAIELHETTQVDGRSRMRRLQGLCLGPGETARLAPGGRHLMLFRLSLDATTSETTIDLLEADGTRHPGRFEVVAFNAVR